MTAEPLPNAADSVRSAKRSVDVGNFDEAQAYALIGIATLLGALYEHLTMPPKVNMTAKEQQAVVDRLISVPPKRRRP